MTRRKQYQPKRRKSSGDEDESDENEEGKKKPMALDDTGPLNHHDNQACSHSNQDVSDDLNDLEVSDGSTENSATMSIGKSVSDNQTNSKSPRSSSSPEHLVSVVNEDAENSENIVKVEHGSKSDKKSSENFKYFEKLFDESKTSSDHFKASVKRKMEVDDKKWLESNSAKVEHFPGKSRPETPPLQKLMRQDFSPLKSNPLYSPSPSKKMKEGFTSKLASVIVPTSSLLPRFASHPKQLMSHNSNKSRSSCLKSVDTSRSSRSTHSHFKPNPFSHGRPLSSSTSEEQPLDLSKKTVIDHDTWDLKPRKHHQSPPYSKHSSHGNGISSSASSSLRSLQQKFGGDFHLRGLRKPTNYMLFGPEIPALHRALLHSPYLPQVHNNGVPKPLSRDDLSPILRGSTPSPKTKSEEPIRSSKSIKTEETLEKSIKVEKGTELSDSTSSRITPPAAIEEEELQNDKYTNHMCTCGKWYNNLYSLSLHLQESGHLPAGSKAVSLLEYPKLVRGQDMWLNQESEQTRRILRCIQCGESFKTLPMLTVHMMKTQHYTKIVSSEHARRAHKCSAYCDREMDKECVFKCKVCQDTFTDMEGLANHMILSGHHKKQMVRPHTYNDVPSFRPKRKRYYNFEESVYGNPTVAALLEYKRKCLPGQFSPDLSVDNDLDSDDLDSTIICENCGHRIETKMFVDHVRNCLGEKLSVGLEMAKRKRKMVSGFEDEREKVFNSKRAAVSPCDDEEPERGLMALHTSSQSERVSSPDNQSVEIKSDLNHCDRQSADRVEEKIGDDTDEKNKNDNETSHTQPDFCSGKEEEDERADVPCEKKSCESRCITETCSDKEIHETTNDTSVGNESPRDSTDGFCVSKPGEQEDLSKVKCKVEIDDDFYGEIKSEKEERNQVKRKEEQTKGGHSDDDDEVEECRDSRRTSSTEPKKKSSNTLDIIDPENLKEGGSSGNSALEAMESFIQKSFNNKFDFKKGNIIITPQSSADGTIHARPNHTPLSKPSAADYFNSYRSFYSSLTNQNGHRESRSDRGDREKNKSRPVECKNGERVRRPSGISDSSEVLRLDSPNSVVSDRDNNGRASVSSSHSEISVDNKETLETKYLNLAERDQSKAETSSSSNGREGKKSSALDNLSSFVYGQPLTSEHPLDSLQRLITKSDIPKLAASGSRAFRYLPPHLQLHSNPDLTMPLNLSLRGRVLEDSDEDEPIKTEEDGLSDCDRAGSPTNSDGEVEYRCAACSRRFASKGSYRYHLSRCHLSSVKRYGIKEAFNMSPYVYLPLDHTAKFSKYYEMAQELANKRK